MNLKNKYSGKARHKLKLTIRTLEYQQRKWGFDEMRAARIKDIKKSLAEKI